MAKIKDFFDETTGTVKNSLLHLKLRYEDMKDDFEEGSEHLFQSLVKLTDISTFSKEKLADFTNSIISISPLLETAGYRVDGISIHATLPPKVSMSLSKIDLVNPEMIQEILSSNEDNELLKLVIKTIVAIDKFQDRLKLGNFELNGFDLDVGFPPGISLKLKNKSQSHSEDVSKHKVASL